MTARGRRSWGGPAVAVLSLVLFVASAAGSIALAGVNAEESRSDPALLFATGCFVAVGALIVARQPGNPIGWLFCTIGLMWSTGSLAVEYSLYAVITAPGSLPTAWIGAWFGEWNWLIFWFGTLVVLPMLFPTGRPLSRRWGIGLRIILILAAGVVVVAMMDPLLEVEATGIQLDNPLGSPLGRDPDDDGWLAALAFPLMFGSALAGAVSLILRFRRSRGDERLQLKWFTFAAVLLVGGFFALALTNGTGVAALGYAFLVALVPVAAGIAILRYRLYDIDLVINRTLVYGALSAILAATYFGIVVLLQRLLTPFTADSDIAVAGSTLAVAGLFGPVRRMVQEFIDRRFYRHRYDARRTLETFSSRLRDHVDLETVNRELVTVVVSMMQPAHASLWLRPGTTGDLG